MKALDSKLLKKFVKLAGERLEGEWVLIGGSLLPLLGVEVRSTVDIDFIRLPGGADVGQNAQSLLLMEVAEKLNLPVETINQAGAHFLKKIPGFRDELIQVQKNERFTLYRPTATLYLQLKIPRLSDSDLLDCLEYLKFASKKGEPVPVNESKVLGWLQAEIKSAPSGETQRLERLERLLAAVQRS